MKILLIIAAVFLVCFVLALVFVLPLAKDIEDNEGEIQDEWDDNERT